MDLRAADGVALRFHAYIEHLSKALGHADRHVPLAEYCAGLLLPGERKSVEPMAARMAPSEVGAKHQSLHHFVAKAPWDETKVLASVRSFVLPIMQKVAPIRAWIVDDTGIPKKGKHSVGVARQYCGELGKQDNCQVAVTLSVAHDQASLPIACRLYLPQTWAEDEAQREKAGVPDEIAFATKPRIALEQIERAIDDGVPAGIVLADAGYGNDTAFRSGVSALGLVYVVGVQGSTAVWAPGTAPLPARKWSGQGRPTKLLGRDDKVKPIKVSDLARTLPRKAWKTVRWREGTRIADGQRRIYLGGKSSIECWLEPKDRTAWRFCWEPAVTGQRLDAEQARASAVHLLGQLAEELHVAPVDLAAVPFDAIANLHENDPFSRRRMSQGRRRPIEQGFVATAPNASGRETGFETHGLSTRRRVR